MKYIFKTLSGIGIVVSHAIEPAVERVVGVHLIVLNHDVLDAQNNAGNENTKAVFD